MNAPRNLGERFVAHNQWWQAADWLGHVYQATMLAWQRPSG